MSRYRFIPSSSILLRICEYAYLSIGQWYLALLHFASYHVNYFYISFYNPVDKSEFKMIVHSYVFLIICQVRLQRFSTWWSRSF